MVNNKIILYTTVSGSANSAKSEEVADLSRETTSSSPLQAAYPPIKADGFVPNSVMVKILWPPPAPDPNEADQWKPPELTAKQLAEIKGIPYEEVSNIVLRSNQYDCSVVSEAGNTSKTKCLS